MTAPTEAEITALIDARSDKFRQGDNSLIDAINEYSDIITWHIEEEDGETIEYGAYVWGDLRPSEGEYLAQLASEARQLAVIAARRAIIGSIFIACQRFAEKYPDAPRSTRKADEP